MRLGPLYGDSLGRRRPSVPACRRVRHAEGLPPGTSPAKVAEEIASNVTAVVEHAGHVGPADHSVPPSVLFENYRLAMATLDRRGPYD